MGPIHRLALSSSGYSESSSSSESIQEVPAGEQQDPSSPFSMLVFNEETLTTYIGRDRGLIEIYKEERLKCSSSLEEALERISHTPAAGHDDLKDKINRIAHDIRGTAGYVGGERVMDSASKLQEACQKLDLDAVATRGRNLQEQLVAFNAEFDLFIEERFSSQSP